MLKNKWFIINLIANLLLCFTIFALAQENEAGSPSSPCPNTKSNQFDFWVGEWELRWPGGQGGTSEGEQGRGVNVIRKILGGCVIKENFSVADSSFVGKSWSVFNTKIGKWQQTWVDNKGNYLLFTGEFEDGKMELRTEPFERNGQTFISRMVFENIEENSLDWNWQRSADMGKTWQDLWNIHYVRKK